VGKSHLQSRTLALGGQIKQSWWKNTEKTLACLLGRREKLIRTVALAEQTLNFPDAFSFRQLPGDWPRGNSLIGNTFVLPPPVDGEYRGDYLIVGTPPPSIVKTKIPKKNRIFILLEPPEFWSPRREFLDQFGVLVTPYQVQHFHGLQVLAPTTGCNWWYGVSKNGHQNTGVFLTFKDILNEPIVPKIHRLSVITSMKSRLPGQKDRLKFIEMVASVLGDNVEVFGHGVRPVSDKREALRPFQFHLALENSVHSDYWTEKLSDPILGRCVVFYHGASRVKHYFPEKSVVPINIYEPMKAVEKIQDTMKDFDLDHYFTDIESARKKILFKYNSIFFIDKLLNVIQGRHAEKVVRFV
jgi:hypothetical protein